MARYSNVSGGALVLPDGTEISRGSDADISDGIAANAGVAEWIAGGKLVKVEAVIPAKTRSKAK